MAKSPTERIRELAEQLAVLTERDAERDRIVARLEAKLETSEARATDKIERLESRLTAMEVENAVLKQQLQDHVAQYQEWDRRRWTLYTVLISAVLALESGLIVTLAKK